MVKVLILSLALLAAGCSTTARGSFCQVAEPFRPSQATIAAMTDAEVAAALAHNRKGQKLCGWRPA